MLSDFKIVCGTELYAIEKFYLLKIFYSLICMLNTVVYPSIKLTKKQKKNGRGRQQHYIILVSTLCFYPLHKVRPPPLDSYIKIQSNSSIRKGDPCSICLNVLATFTSPPPFTLAKKCWLTNGKYINQVFFFHSKKVHPLKSLRTVFEKSFFTLFQNQYPKSQLNGGRQFFLHPGYTNDQVHYEHYEIINIIKHVRSPTLQCNTDLSSWKSLR